MSTRYEVVLALSTEGNLGAKLGEVGGRADKAQSSVMSIGSAARSVGDSFERMSSRVAGVIDSVVDKAVDIGVGLAKVGAGMAVAGAVYGVGHLNNQLEQTQISLASIFQAQGFFSTFEGGWRAAGDQVAKMKKDVQTLPGDLGQLSDIMKMIATPAAQAGAGVDQIRKLAGQTMLTSTILGVPQEVASREMAQLLSGRAGAHNIFGARLGLIGDEAKKFNALAPEARLSKINEELGKYKGAADRFGGSFVAQWTTLKDNIKYGLAAPVTSPLFEHVRTTIGEINDWFDRNKDKVSDFTRRVGLELASAWDRAVMAAKKLEPIVEKIAGHVGNLMSGQDLGKLGAQAATAFAVGKLLPAGLEAVGGIGGAAGGAAGGLGAVAGFAAVAMAAIGAAGAINQLTDSSNHFHDDTVKKAKGSWDNIKDGASKLGGAFENLHSFMDIEGSIFTNTISVWSASMSVVAGLFEKLTAPVGSLLDVLASHMPGYKAFNAGLNAGDREVDNAVPFELPGSGSGLRAMASLDEAAKSIVKRQAPTQNIQKVEIVVKGNDDPSRVARLTLKELQNLVKNPKASKYVPNYASPHLGT